MDKARLLEKIESQAPGQFWINALRIHHWGGELHFECEYRLENQATSVPFHLILKDCRDIQWRVYTHLQRNSSDSLPPANLVNLRLGTAQHRKPLMMLTDAFGINAYYGEMLITKV